MLKRVEDVGDHALALGLLDVAIRQRQIDVLVDRQVVEQVIALEDEADVLLLQPHAVLRRQLVHRLVEQPVLAGPGAVVHAHDVQQRALAGARRAHDRHELALLDVDVDAAQDEGLRQAVPVALLDVSQFDHRLQ